MVSFEEYSTRVCNCLRLIKRGEGHSECKLTELFSEATGERPSVDYECTVTQLMYEAGRDWFSYCRLAVFGREKRASWLKFLV